MTADAEPIGPGASDHFDGRVFFNPHDLTVRTLRDVWRWRRAATPAPWPDRVEDPPQPPPRRAGPGRIAATFIGHSSVLVQLGGRCVLLDPVWSRRASPLSILGPRRVRPPGQPLEALPGVDLLLVSHNHYDHMDLPTLRAVRRRFGPPAATALGNARHLAKAGLHGATELD